MGVTSGKALPYPEGTDPARDGDNAIKALAEAVDVALPGAWTTYTPALASGHVLGSGLFRAAYKLLDAKTLLLNITYNVGSGVTLPAQITFGLPAGKLAAVADTRTQSIMVRYYTAGTQQLVGFASTSVSYSNGGVIGLVADGGGSLGSSQLSVGSNLDVNGILELV